MQKAHGAWHSTQLTRVKGAYLQECQRLVQDWGAHL